MIRYSEREKICRERKGQKLIESEIESKRETEIEMVQLSRQNSLAYHNFYWYNFLTSESTAV